MVTWARPTVSEFDPAVPGLVPNKRTVGNLDGSPDDTEIVTRMFARTEPVSEIEVRADVNFVAGDVSANPNRRLGLSVFIAPAYMFESPPTPLQIVVSGNTTVFRSNNSLTSPGTLSAVLKIPRGPWLQKNLKYWALVLPCAWKAGSTPRVGNDYLVNGELNEKSRVFSFWASRNPTEPPTVISPATGSTYASGETFTLEVAASHPDASPNGTNYIYRDVAGYQVQYAPVPTAAVPNPAWTDLPVADMTSVTTRGGWFIDKSTANGPNPGARALLTGGVLGVKAGSSAPEAGKGILPGGTWQIRVRSFSYAHPFPLQTTPGGANVDRAQLAPSTYPANATSPWSTPVIVSVPSQVPPPTPISPAYNVAITENAPVRFIWIYRNTFAPTPLAQEARTIQYREVDTDAWLTLLSRNESDSSSYTEVNPPFVAGKQYEWRVKTEDTDNVESTYSAPARFWVAPAPLTGSSGLTPTEALEGATLGIGTHTAMIYRKGGQIPVAQITGLTYVSWERVRDEISNAKIVVENWDLDAGNLLASLQTWAYELVLYRDAGFGSERVWEGPITTIRYERDKVTISAKDVMAWPYRRIIKQTMNDNTIGARVTTRALRVIQNVLAPDDPNVLRNMHIISFDDDAVQYRALPEYARTGYEEIDDMAARAGLDYTVVNRSIILWSTRHRIGTLPEFRDEDLGESPIVTEYGMSFANYYAVSDGNGVWGDASHLPVSGNDEIYGNVEMLSSTWAEETDDEEGTYTAAGLETMKKSFAEYAERSIADRYPPPVTVRLPENTGLNPRAPISIQHLVPGVLIPLRSTSTLRTVTQSQKLNTVRVVEENGAEQVSISMSPFTSDDAEPEGETDV